MSRWREARALACGGAGEQVVAMLELGRGLAVAALARAAAALGRGRGRAVAVKRNREHVVMRRSGRR